VQRNPCCWKWHSSSNQRSISSFAARRGSFFISTLRFWIGFSNQRPGFSSPKPHLAEQTLALPDTQGYAKSLLEMMTEKFPIPKILSISKITRGLTQMLRDFFKDGLIHSAGTTRTWSFFQTCKTTFPKAVDPVLNCTKAVAEKFRDFATAEAVANQQDSMQTMAVSGFFRSQYLLLNGSLYDVCFFYFKSAHLFFLSAISIAKGETYANIYDGVYKLFFDYFSSMHYKFYILKDSNVIEWVASDGN